MEANADKEETTLAFWRKLAEEFRALARNAADLRADWQYVLGSRTNDPTTCEPNRYWLGDWRLVGGTKSARIEFAFLATQAVHNISRPERSSAIPEPRDSLHCWLDELMHPPLFRYDYQVDDVTGRKKVQSLLTGTLSRPCEASADRCNELAIEALEAERRKRTSASREDLQRDIPKQPAVSAGFASLTSAPNIIEYRLSDRDLKVHNIVGEKNFRTLTNAEIMRNRTLSARLTRECGLKRGDAAKSCLDRIRKANGYPGSREITKKRSRQQS